jgi:hypothetical protein
MTTIYGMNKMGYVETQWDGEALTTLASAQSYADTVDGEVYVSHDGGATWEPYQPPTVTATNGARDSFVLAEGAQLVGGPSLHQHVGWQILTEAGWETITAVTGWPHGVIWVNTAESDQAQRRDADRFQDRYLSQVRAKPDEECEYCHEMVPDVRAPLGHGYGCPGPVPSAAELDVRRYVDSED